MTVFEGLKRKESASAALDAYGVTYCEKCGAELLCNECGDMPDACPRCGRLIDWSAFTEAAGACAFGPDDFQTLVYAPCAVR